MKDTNTGNIQYTVNLDHNNPNDLRWGILNSKRLLEAKKNTKAIIINNNKNNTIIAEFFLNTANDWGLNMFPIRLVLYSGDDNQ